MTKAQPTEEAIDENSTRNAEGSREGPELECENWPVVGKLLLKNSEITLLPLLVEVTRYF